MDGIGRVASRTPPGQIAHVVVDTVAPPSDAAPKPTVAEKMASEWGLTQKVGSGPSLEGGLCIQCVVLQQLRAAVLGGGPPECGQSEVTVVGIVSD